MKTAKFAIFQIFESGADQLYKSRDEYGDFLVTILPAPEQEIN